MSDDANAGPKMPGMATFKKPAVPHVGDPGPLTEEQRAKLATVNQSLGLDTRPEPPRGKATARPVTFDDRVNIRVQAKDRERFEEFAHRNRLNKGAAFERIMDLAEGAEAQASPPRK